MTMEPRQHDTMLVGPDTGTSAACAPVLRDLPDWFGIESATRRYIADIETLPTFRAVHDGETIGFLSLRRHFPESAEIHVMGIRAAAHRRGIGRRLVAAAEAHLRDDGCRCLQVKTVSPARACSHYARTRAFYRAVGFIPLEEFPTLWDPVNPCLLFVKSLEAGATP